MASTSTAGVHYTTQLLQQAVPLIKNHGFSLKALQIASTQIISPPSSSSSSSSSSSASSSSSSPLSISTLNALFPSPPPSSTQLPRRIKRHPNGNYTSSTSLTREELIREAKASTNETAASTISKSERIHQQFEQKEEEERQELSRQSSGGGIGIGPIKALVEQWLKQGRIEMIKEVHKEVSKTPPPSMNPIKQQQDHLVKEGLRFRLRYNETVAGGQLIEALALLGTDTSTPLSSPLSSSFPFPSPLPHLNHVAKIAHDLAKASGDQSQGLNWYSTRTEISTLYGLSELFQISDDLKTLSSEERLKETYVYLDELLEKRKSLGGVLLGGEFLNWVGKSWMGMGRSLGL